MDKKIVKGDPDDERLILGHTYKVIDIDIRIPGKRRKTKVARNMIKYGDKAKGFKFRTRQNSANMSYHKQMDRFVGVEGVVTDVGADTFSIFYDGIGYWSYPIKEYLVIQREEKLKEIGI